MSSRIADLLRSIGTGPGHACIVRAQALIFCPRWSEGAAPQWYLAGAFRRGDQIKDYPECRLGCRRALCWNSMWRNLQRHEVILSGGEVNWLIDGPCGEGLPTIDFAHVDLTGGEQRPEQHGGSLC